MQKYYIKIVILLFAVLAIGAGVFSMDRTWSYLSDMEISFGNLYSAATLNFSLDPENLGDISLKDKVNISVVNDGTIPFKYRVKAQAEDDGVCDHLYLNAVLNGGILYEGSFEDFNAENLISQSEDEWELVITNPPSDTLAQNCPFILIFESWQEGLSYEEGFTTEKFAKGVIVKKESGPYVPVPGDVVINEIMWMGSGDNGGQNPFDEWIELRNMTDFPINIGGWTIENARSSNHELMIPGQKVINPRGYFLIAHWPDTSRNSALNVGVDEVNASLNLNNNYSANGSLILKNGGNTVIDSTFPPVPGNIEWPAGKNTPDIKKSMSRNDNPAGGWHTCEPEKMSESDLALMKSTWDENAGDYNCGTPGYYNISGSYIPDIAIVNTTAVAGGGFSAGGNEEKSGGDAIDVENVAGAEILTTNDENQNGASGDGDEANNNNEADDSSLNSVNDSEDS